VLSDPETCSRYDRFGEDFRRIPEDYHERLGGFSGFGGGRRAGPRVHFAEGAGGAGFNFDDVFGDLFCGAWGFGPITGADQKAERWS